MPPAGWGNAPTQVGAKKVGRGHLLLGAISIMPSQHRPITHLWDIVDFAPRRVGAVPQPAGGIYLRSSITFVSVGTFRKVKKTI